MDGVLIVDKPAGVTSHDVVDLARKKLKTRKVGHGGTLDPDATGVLVIGVGKATRLLRYAQGDSKTYLADVIFGVSTTTQDASGEVIESKDTDLTEDEVADALDGFRGEIEQIPPMVSAVKVGGERLYEKARRGEEVEREARKVTIHSLELLRFDASGDKPEASLEVECSGGTYIRTLAHDLGATLGCGAHLAKLRRTRSGAFDETEAIPADEIAPGALLPLREAVRGLPQVEVDEASESKIAVGAALAPLSDVEGACALLRDGRLLGIYRNEGERAVAEKVIPQS